jgi:hypothetical protein
MSLLKAKHTPFSRRGFLRGAGATMALPFFESWVPASQAAAATTSEAGPPLRMGIYSIGAGTVKESFFPEESCDLKSLPKLPSILRSLDFARDEMLILSGLAHNGRHDGLSGHKSAWYCHLTGANYFADENGKPVNTISVDQRAAQVVGHKSLIPDLRVGPDVPFSFRENGTPLTAESLPSAVFARMFRGRTPVVPNWENRAKAGEIEVDPDSITRADRMRKSVLDLVLSQANDLRKDMGRADRVKIDEFLASVRGVETSIEKFERRIALEHLDRQNPGPGHLVRESVPSQAESKRMMEIVKNDPNVLREYVNIMSDLMVLAFQTDTTRVMTMIPDSAGVGSFPGVVTVGTERNYHVLQHNGNGRPDSRDPIAREACRQIHEWQTSIFAEMIRKMQAIDEGGSSLLDNSMILYTSYMANGGHHRYDYPAILFGKAKGTLKPGRHVKYEDRTPMSNLYVEMLERMGDTRGEFGESLTSDKAQYNGRLPGLV